MNDNQPAHPAIDRRTFLITVGGLSVSMMLVPAGLAAAPKTVIDSDTGTAQAPTDKVYARLKIDPAGINVIAANLGKKGRRKTSGTDSIEWKILAPAAGLYAVTVVLVGKDSHLVLTCNGENQEATVQETEWERMDLGQVNLNAGENTLLLTVAGANGFKFDGLELTQPAVKASLLKEALAARQQPDWFKDAGYGLMFQWAFEDAPRTGPIKDWEGQVNGFDVPAFVNLVEESGAAYVLWSVTWGWQYISAPIASLDRILKGRTAQRDLLGEIADALHKRGIKLIFYYHYGYNCYHAKDTAWMKATGGYKADKTELFQNLINIVSETGNRYGDKLDGWWFDGGSRYYNCHFDGTSGAEGILSAPFKAITQAARSGNARRIVSYNSGTNPVKPRLTEYQDYCPGEGLKQISGPLKAGVFETGSQQGLMAHGCFKLEKSWGHNALNTPIASPQISLEKLTACIKQAQANRYPLSINLEMYEDGSASPESQALMKQVREVIRKK